VVLYAEGEQDYRLRALTRSPVYRAPLDAESEAWLAGRWQELAGAAAQRDEIQIDGRSIAMRGRSKDLAWFDFAELCEGPRAASDYIALATEFQTLLVGGIPTFDRMNEDAARRFVNLIDEVYDRHVKLVCTAAALPVALYAGTRLAGAFERTASRLIEMQSAEYLATAHRG
jgi:cell division protein ZapE